MRERAQVGGDHRLADGGICAQQPGHLGRAFEAEKGAEAQALLGSVREGPPSDGRPSADPETGAAAPWALPRRRGRPLSGPARSGQSQIGFVQARLPALSTTVTRIHGDAAKRTMGTAARVIDWPWVAVAAEPWP